ncbi:MAG: septum formation initiator family protein [Candidatus Borkfalkiaceae bacterium]|nr:septum formation initiator family protein [Christensenellaceae bacterium]
MTETKMRRLVSAGTAMSVVLLFVLLFVMVCQLVSLSVKKKEIDRLRSEIETLEREIERTEDEVDTWLQEWKIEERARQLGMVEKKQ